MFLYYCLCSLILYRNTRDALMRCKRLSSSISSGESMSSPLAFFYWSFFMAISSSLPGSFWLYARDYVSISYVCSAKALFFLFLCYIAELHTLWSMLQLELNSTETSTTGTRCSGFLPWTAEDFGVGDKILVSGISSNLKWDRLPPVLCLVGGHSGVNIEVSSAKTEHESKQTCLKF